VVIRFRLGHACMHSAEGLGAWNMSSISVSGGDGTGSNRQGQTCVVLCQLPRMRQSQLDASQLVSHLLIYTFIPRRVDDNSGARRSASRIWYITPLPASGCIH
jgi:hypothetical protein